MKLNQSFSTRLSLYVIIATSVLCIGGLVVAEILTIKELDKSVTKDAGEVLKIQIKDVEKILAEVETATEDMVWVVKENLANAELYDELIKQLNIVVEQDPGHADAYYNLGVAYAGHKEDSKAAIGYFEKALKAQPDHMLAAHGKKLMEEMAAE